jgi:hypothetical protein
MSWCDSQLRGGISPPGHAKPKMAARKCDERLERVT